MGCLTRPFWLGICSLILALPSRSTICTKPLPLEVDGAAAERRSTEKFVTVVPAEGYNAGAVPELAKKLGFEQFQEQFVCEDKSTATLYRHKKTGAEIMSVVNDDENKVFGIVFRTPPPHSRNNTYSVDSGGDPTVIPDLTFEQF